MGELTHGEIRDLQMSDEILEDKSLVNDHMGDILCPLCGPLSTKLPSSLDAESPRGRDVVVWKEN